MINQEFFQRFFPFRMRYTFLLHYLFGKGERKKFPYAEEAERLVKKLIIIDPRCSKYNKNFTIEWMNPMNYYPKFLPEKLAKDMYLSVGKFKVYKIKNKVIIEDYYVFYPTCGRYFEHDHTCQCKEKKWNDVCIFEIKIPIISFLNGRVKNIHIGKYLTIYMIFYDLHLNLEIKVMDSLFEKIGNPFYSRHEFYLDK